MKLNPYLNFNGNCRAAFEFYQQHLGGKITFVMTYGQNPDAHEAAKQPDAILHASIEIAGVQLQASDVLRDDYQPIHSSYLSLVLDSIEEAERVFGLLTEGGQTFLPMQETFWAHRFGMCRDRFGVPWMISAERPMPAAP
ncbi:MAG TPA: VOC family protein [Bryobacteraceae bacterium]|jgi:PhnB protein|nr:VOC family protein [Bryobacteraceae bacterium]